MSIAPVIWNHVVIFAGVFLMMAILWIVRNAVMRILIPIARQRAGKHPRFQQGISPAEASRVELLGRTEPIADFAQWLPRSLERSSPM